MTVVFVKVPPRQPTATQMRKAARAALANKSYADRAATNRWRSRAARTVTHHWLEEVPDCDRVEALRQLTVPEREAVLLAVAAGAADRDSTPMMLTPTQAARTLGTRANTVREWVDGAGDDAPLIWADGGGIESRRMSDGHRHFARLDQSLAA